MKSFSIIIVTADGSTQHVRTFEKKKSGCNGTWPDSRLTAGDEQGFKSCISFNAPTVTTTKAN